MQKLVFLCLFLFVGSIAVYSQTIDMGSMPSLESLSKSKLGYKVNENSNKTWGYDILMNSKKIIHQPNIPGMAGHEGFKTKAGATSVAKLAISKIKKGQMPPTISPAEMKAVKAI